MYREKWYPLSQRLYFIGSGGQEPIGPAISRRGAQIMVEELKSCAYVLPMYENLRGAIQNDCGLLDDCVKAAILRRHEIYREEDNTMSIMSTIYNSVHDFVFPAESETDIRQKYRRQEYRRLMKAIAEDKEVFHDCVLEAVKRGYDIYGHAEKERAERAEKEKSSEADLIKMVKQLKATGMNQDDIQSAIKDIGIRKK